MAADLIVALSVGLVLAGGVLWWFLRRPAGEGDRGGASDPATLPPPADRSGLRRRPSLASLEVKALNDEDELVAFGEEEEDEITVVRVDVESGSPPQGRAALTEVIVADSGAEEDVPTAADLTLLTSACAQSDRGRKRKKNEDRYLKLGSEHIYAVADGMGGYAGGEIAAQVAVDTLKACFQSGRFDAQISGDGTLPWRAEELVKAVQQANLEIYERGRREPWLQEMGTTLVAARFAPRKERLYVAHVGDSRCYRLRDGRLAQLTTDHTLGQLGIIDDGPTADALSRAVGVKPTLTIDVIIAKPQIGDVYLLCSDGLSRMIEEAEEIGRTVEAAETLQDGAEALVKLANERGGKDNVTVVLVEVTPPAKLLGVPDDRVASA